MKASRTAYSVHTRVEHAVVSAILMFLFFFPTILPYRSTLSDTVLMRVGGSMGKGVGKRCH